jgi:hypothetical protein
VPAAAASLGVVKLANAADAAIAPTFMRLRRDLRIPVGTLSRAVIFALRTIAEGNFILSDRVEQIEKWHTGISFLLTILSFIKHLEFY